MLLGKKKQRAATRCIVVIHPGKQTESAGRGAAGELLPGASWNYSNRTKHCLEGAGGLKPLLISKSSANSRRHAGPGPGLHLPPHPEENECPGTEITLAFGKSQHFKHRENSQPAPKPALWKPDVQDVLQEKGSVIAVSSVENTYFTVSHGGSLKDKCQGCCRAQAAPNAGEE